MFKYYSLSCWPISQTKHGVVVLEMCLFQNFLDEDDSLINYVIPAVLDILYSVKELDYSICDRMAFFEPQR